MLAREYLRTCSICLKDFQIYFTPGYLNQIKFFHAEMIFFSVKEFHFVDVTTAFCYRCILINACRSPYSPAD